LSSPATQADVENGIVDFFKRIERLGGLLQRVTNGGTRAVVEFRGSGNRVLLDLVANPIQVIAGKQGLKGTTTMAATPQDLHETLLGKLAVMKGINQRRLLTKGGMCHLVAFFPIFDLVPVLYAEHLMLADSQKKKPGWFRRTWAAFFGFFFRMFACMGGLAMRGHKPKELIEAFTKMSRSAGRFSPLIENKKPNNKKNEKEHPLQAPRPSFFRSVWLKTVSGFLYLAGWKISFLKYKLKVPIDLFRIIESLSNALGRLSSSGEK